MSQHNNIIILGTDIMFINKLPSFLSTMSHNINFCTAVLLLDKQKQETLADCVKRVQRICLKRGFQVAIFLMDGQIDSNCGNLADLNIPLAEHRYPWETCTRN